MDFSTLLTLLRNGDHSTCAVASEADCCVTELALGVQLPPSFRKFVTEFSNGAYLYWLQEVSAVGTGNRQIAAIQNIVGSVRGADADQAIPFRDDGHTTSKYLVPFSLDSNGNAWCFVTGSARDGEYPVAYFESNARKLYAPLSGFSEWMEILVNEQMEVIRCIYGDDVINDELGLG